MKLDANYTRKDLYELPVNSGWLITKNELYTSDLEDLEVLFNATNLITGKAISVDYDEELELFSLNLIEQIRNNGKWDLIDFSDSRMLVESHSINDILIELKEILGGATIQLVNLKVPVWWFVRRNVFSNNEGGRANQFNTEFLFEAFSTKKASLFHIELMVHCTEDERYSIFIGQSDHKIPKNGISRFHNPSFIKTRLIKQSTINEAVAFVNDFLSAPDNYFEN